MRKGYMKPLLGVERSREEGQFMTDIQTLTFSNGDSDRLFSLIAEFHFFPVLKKVCKLENMCNLS